MPREFRAVKKELRAAVLTRWTLLRRARRSQDFASERVAAHRRVRVARRPAADGFMWIGASARKTTGRRAVRGAAAEATRGHEGGVRRWLLGSGGREPCRHQVDLEVKGGVRP